MPEIEYYKRLSAVSDAYGIMHKGGRTIFAGYYHDERIVGGKNICYCYVDSQEGTGSLSYIVYL
jgi:hypothetical protein